ncbi:MAG: ABC transporter ATP-binding protein [bacterium]|nr:ABC transporter ATP-binding protein [bacterium]
MLKITNLTKGFGLIRALDNLSLTVNEGEIYALIGPNGAGKTTTIKIIAGLYISDSGAVEFSGKEKKLIGYIPDEPNFYPGLTGMEFLNFIGGLYRVSDSRKNAVLAKFSKIYPFGEILGGDPNNYSRGNRQKLAICAAFLTDPKLLLVDEPIVGLDPQSARATLELFTTFAKDGGSILLSTHTLAVAEEIAHRVGIIDHGKLIAEGNLKTLRQKAKLKTGHLEEVFLKLTEE